MQTTLRIDDKLYREAKAEAARQGMTITRFIEEALRMRLERSPAPSGPVEFTTFAAEGGFDFDPEALKELIRRSEAEHDAEKLTR